MDPIIHWAEEFSTPDCGPASKLWICVTGMALLTDPGRHQLITSISATLAQALWSCGACWQGHCPAILAAISALCRATSSCCSLTEPDHAEGKPLKNQVCSPGCEGSYRAVFLEISRIEVLWAENRWCEKYQVHTNSNHWEVCQWGDLVRLSHFWVSQSICIYSKSAFSSLLMGTYLNNFLWVRLLEDKENMF